MIKNCLLLLKFSLVTIFFCFSQTGFGQGVTTGAIEGIVTDSKGSALPGASILATHTTSGTMYGTASRSDGRFTFPAVRVGGPYTIKITFIGYKDQLLEGINISLGEKYTVDSKLADESTQLTEVVITGDQNAIINSDRTGASTTITNSQIRQLPTLSRSLSDYTRLVPQSNGASFGGRNNLYNNFTVDGALFNNSFGLSSSIGGQSNAQPISLDAIEQVQVNLAPYDVRQGSFTGAGINAVTKSGTNEFSGSAYTFYRDQSLTGYKVKDIDLFKQNTKTQQTGFRLGGPIIKNKLFFFINGEVERKDDPGTFLIANRPGVTIAPGNGSNVANVLATDLDALSTFLKTKYNYDPGPYENYSLLTYSDKATAKIDWNINQQHKFTIKYNYLKSYRDNPPSNSGTFAGGGSASFSNLPFQSNFYRINNNFNSVIAELNSSFGNKASNNFTIGYIAMRDFRESQVNPTPFPTTQITNMTSFGYEAFSAGNKLNTNIFQVSDYFTKYFGKHTVTLGTYNEAYHFENGFAPNFYGAYSFANLQSFYNSANNSGPVTGNFSYTLQYSAQGGSSFPIAKFNALQLGLFIQDEWAVSNKLKLTAGIRADIPFVTTTLDNNPVVDALTFRDGQKADVSKFQDAKPLWSPRVGVNWDVNGDKKTQVRGGTGIFTGRIPYVWISNQAGNNGLLYGQLNSTVYDQTKFGYQAAVHNENIVPGPAASFNLAVTDKNFKFPQVWRTNIAVDQKLPLGLIGTLEFIYTKDVNAVFHQNINLPNPSGRAVPVTDGGDNREIFYTINPGTGATTPVNQINKNIVTGGSGGAVLMTNTNKGYSYNATATLSKQMKDLYVSASYVYTQSKSVNDGGSIAASIFRDRASYGDPNKDVLGISTYQLKHRVIASATYRKEYLNHFGTSVAIFYEAAPAGVFSYTMSGDVSGDGRGGASGSSNLIWIPRTAADINLQDLKYTYKDASNATVNVTYTAAQQRQDLENYINQDKYLSKHRGEFAERNGGQLPWQYRMDFRLLQDFFVNAGGKRNTIQLSLDIFNLGNLLNKNWGVAQQTSRPLGTQNNVALLTYKGYTPTGQPIYSFDPIGNPSAANPNVTPLTSTFNTNTGIGSRYQMQVGIRYIFN